MDQLPMKAILDSPLFTFEVGHQKKEIKVHSQVMANLSPALDALINGKMREAITQRVNWSDVDEIVFFQLCEFAYSKDYTVPSPDRITVSTPNTAATGDPNDDSEKSEAQKQTIHSHNDTPSAEHQESSNTALAGSEDLTGSEDSYSSTFEIDGNWENAMTLTEKFLGDRYFTGKGTFNLEELNQWSQFNPYPQMEWFPEMASKGYSPDLTSVLIEQARLYALSDLWGIEELRKLVVFKTYEILKFFTDDRVALKGTLEFVSFVYDRQYAPYYGIFEHRFYEKIGRNIPICCTTVSRQVCCLV